MSFCANGGKVAVFSVCRSMISAFRRPPHGLTQRIVDDLKVRRRMFLVEPPERAERRQDHGEPVRPVAVRHGREDPELGLLLRHRRVRHLGQGRRADHQRLDGAEAESEIDLLRRPGGHLRVGRDHEDDCISSLPGPDDRDIHGHEYSLS